MECKFCDARCQLAGKQKNRVQRYFCKVCKKYQQETYKYKAYHSNVNSYIPVLVCEGVGIRGIGRVLRISVGTVLKRILGIANMIPKPPIPLRLAEGELDELRTYIGRKEN